MSLKLVAIGLKDMMFSFSLMIWQVTHSLMSVMNKVGALLCLANDITDTFHLWSCLHTV